MAARQARQLRGKRGSCSAGLYVDIVAMANAAGSITSRDEVFLFIGGAAAIFLVQHSIRSRILATS